MPWKSVIPVAVVSGVLGCLAAVAIVAEFNLGGGHTKTVVQQAPLRGQDASNDGDGSGLTPREIYKRVAPGVVYIRAQVVQSSQSPFDFGFPQEQRGEATGSGFVVDKGGTILTNAHVVAGATKVTVQFADRHVVDARILGRDESTDLALLHVDVDADAKELTPLPLGTSKGVQVGDPTIAIGNPFGLERTLTTGVVSATKRTIQAPDGFEIDGVIQTDAAINPGNSGGPLLDAAGRVIGINSQIETGGNGQGSVGIGFAVPIDTARKLLPELERNGKVDRGFLGVEQPLTIDESLSDLNLPVPHGVLVQTVTPGSPAAKAGIMGGDIIAQLAGNEIRLGGDIITAIDGKKIRTSEDLAKVISDKKQGDKVKIDIVRQGKKLTVEVALAARPAQATGGG
jgi:putative serine protease PepD